MLPQKDPTALPCTRQVAEDGKCELLERGAGLNDALEARDDPSLCRFFLPRFVETTEVVARLEDVVGHFLHDEESERSDAREGDLQTYRPEGSGALFVKNLHEDLDRVSVLQYFEDGGVHGQMLHGLEHLDQVLGIEKLAGSQ